MCEYSSVANLSQPFFPIHFPFSSLLSNGVLLGGVKVVFGGQMNEAQALLLVVVVVCIIIIVFIIVFILLPLLAS